MPIYQNFFKWNQLKIKKLIAFNCDQFSWMEDGHPLSIFSAEFKIIAKNSKKFTNQFNHIYNTCEFFQIKLTQIQKVKCIWLPTKRKTIFCTILQYFLQLLQFKLKIWKNSQIKLIIEITHVNFFKLMLWIFHSN